MPTPWIESPTAGAVGAVAMRMRLWDRREIFATRWDDDAGRFAQEICRAFAHGMGFVAGRGCLPIAVFGGAELWPGLWQVIAFATDEFPLIGAAVTRFIRTDVLPRGIARGAHRAECKSLAEHSDAHRWLEALGARREAEHPGFGRNGETFVTYAWRPDDVRKSLRRRLQPAAAGAPAPTAARCDD